MGFKDHLKSFAIGVAAIAATALTIGIGFGALIVLGTAANPLVAGIAMAGLSLIGMAISTQIGNSSWNKHKISFNAGAAAGTVAAATLALASISYAPKNQNSPPAPRDEISTAFRQTAGNGSYKSINQVGERSANADTSLASKRAAPTNQF